MTQRKIEAPRVIACCGGMVTPGGAERMMFEVLRTLRSKGASILCVVNDWENHRIVALATEIGAAHAIGPYRHPLRRQRQSIADIMRSAFAVARCSSRLLALAYRFKPTHVLVPEIFSLVMNAPALLAMRAFGITVIYHMHDSPPPVDFYRRFWRMAGTRFVDRFICVSDFVAGELRNAGVRPSKISRIYNAVPTRPNSETVGQQRDYRQIIYVGQIIPGKGIAVLLEAVAALVAKGIDARLIVVGNAFDWIAPEYESYRANLFTRAAENDLNGRIEFLGWRNDVPSLMAASAVHCCPSLPELREACPVVVFEAKEGGIPSIGFVSGGLPELIEHAKDGWIAKEVSAEALGEGLEFFLSNRERLIEAGEAVRQSAERLGIDRFRREWEAVFEFPNYAREESVEELALDSHTGAINA